jgi:type I restriction enzyme R subunit
MPYNPDAESELEAATLALFHSLGWETVNAYEDDLGRDHRGEVILHDRLRAALERLNPGLPGEALARAREELARGRGTMALVQANREIYLLLKDGVKAPYRDEAGEEQIATVRVIDWQEPGNNDWLLAQQFWVAGEVYLRRADLVGFVNGLPLFFGELKAHHKHVKDAYDKNLRDYKATIPHLFWYNAFVLLSNGSDARIGSLNADWRYFGRWKKINDEGEAGVIDLETAVRAACAPARFLDLVENFSLFQESHGGLRKVVALNHQYLGVNNALAAVQSIKQNRGRLGVYWHTQGSGKSFSMLFFCQKVLRTLPGNWTFVVITDRIDLDDQICKNFARCGVVTESEDRVRAQSGEHLRQLLTEDHLYVFTLIQKFGTERGQRYPKLSDRDDIIVVTDEAHRSQYDILAMNMRDALPRAAFMAYTATPLIVGEERTRETFGPYVSVYGYKQAVVDGATVPLYYENRIPELELTNQELNRDMDDLLEAAELDDAQEARLAREFRREYHLITRDDRLEKVAEDIAGHFVNRGHLGKGMVISIDKLTTVKMYDKVQRHWRRTLAALQAELEDAEGEQRDEIARKVAYMRETDMAVVISSGQNEVETFAKAGLEILPHRKRMNSQALDEKFKDPDDPFRLVFVCAMWRTGFDAPSCSTIYLDRPMRNHTLMQTIARANRVFGEKHNGLIVDYIGVFRNLQQALAIYGTGPDGELAPGERPVESKDALLADLQTAIEDAQAFLSGLGVALDPMLEASTFERIALMDDAVDAILVSDRTKDDYFALTALVDRLFKAILPDRRAGDYGPQRHALVTIAAKIRALTPPADISQVMGEVEDLLDHSVSARGYVIRETGERYDLSKIDFETLRERFKRGRKRIEVEKLRGALHARLQRMVHLNRSRMDYLATFQAMIDAYNEGSKNVETLFEELVQFTQTLDKEAQRGVAEGLSEEELAVFDILTRPGPKLSAKEKQTVKKAARDLLATLKANKLVLDWRKRQQSRAAVQVTIRDYVWELPESCYSDAECEVKEQALYQHVYEHYWGAGESTYQRVA